MNDTVWVLFRTEPETNATVLCGTAFSRLDATAWSNSHTLKGAVALPLNDLALGETW